MREFLKGEPQTQFATSFYWCLYDVKKASPPGQAKSSTALRSSRWISSTPLNAAAVAFFNTITNLEPMVGGAPCRFLQLLFLNRICTDGNEIFNSIPFNTGELLFQPDCTFHSWCPPGLETATSTKVNIHVPGQPLGVIKPLLKVGVESHPDRILSQIFPGPNPHYSWQQHDKLKWNARTLSLSWNWTLSTWPTPKTGFCILAR